MRLGYSLTDVGADGIPHKLRKSCAKGLTNVQPALYGSTRGPGFDGDQGAAADSRRERQIVVREASKVSLDA